MDWPATLPQDLQLAGFSETFGDGAVRTSMDAGPAFQRPRYTAVVVPMSGTITVNATQYAALKTFWAGTGYGALPFDWKHPISGAAASFQFTGPPQIAAASGTLFTVSLSLQLLP